MKVSYNITQNKFNASLNQETTEIKVSFKTGYYPFPSDLDLSNYYTKDETYSKTEVDEIISEIPVVDTSNLVPYTGANKDVNIASNYFKTSKGFDFTKDENNYFRTSNNGSYNTFEFYSKNNFDNNIGGIYIVVNPEEDGLQVGAFDSNNIETNYFKINKSETFSTKPFTSDIGFKTTTGTATQALTSDGGVYDLTIKADLVGGKVPSSQLPSYVDDVLEFANLASFPTTGESGKIYIAIDTNLTYRWGGSSYVVMSSSLALGETASTAYRGDRGKIAYDHSQETGNPHDTKLEQLTDVSGDATSIIDTDVILKKETGGFWRKITWVNIKSTLKTYFDNIYAPKSFNVKVTTPSAWVTGTLSETEIYRFSIPANTISSDSILNIESMLFNKTGVNGAFQIRVKLTTSATMPTGSTEQIARSPNITPNTRATAIRKKFYVNDNIIKSQGFDSGLLFDEFNNTDVISTRTLDRTQTYNVIISVILNNASDQVRLEGLDFNIK